MNGGAGIYNPSRVRSRLQKLGEEPKVLFDRIEGFAPDDLRPAAVLIPLTEIDGQMNAVFTKRPDWMAEHSGEISFPGGRVDDSDRNVREAALREAHEEIALVPQDVQFYGSLVRMPTVTGYDITTFVGEFEQPYTLDPNPREIDTLFMAPLEELADPRRHREEMRKWRGHSFDLHFYDFEEYVIWGATGYMLWVLLQFLERNDLDVGSAG